MLGGTLEGNMKSHSWVFCLSTTGSKKWMCIYVKHTECSSSILRELHWLPIDARIKFKIATLTFKAVNTSNPPYLASLLHQHNPCRSLRSASANLLSVTRCNLSFGTRGFRTAAPTVWNSLPLNVRSCKSLATFRKHLKSHLFQSSFPTA